MSNGALQVHAQMRHSQGLSGNLVLLLCIKADRRWGLNYNLHILDLGADHRLWWKIQAKSPRSCFTELPGHKDQVVMVRKVVFTHKLMRYATRSLAKWMQGNHGVTSVIQFNKKKHNLK